jgi:hypothetical protein
VTETPSSAPTGDRDLLRAMLAGQGDLSRVDVEVTLSGGAPSERYEFDLRVPGSGKVTGRVTDQLAGEDRGFERDLEAAGRRDLMARLSATGLLEGPRIQPPFPPDTVVGKIRIMVDDRVVDEWYVLLDPQQVSTPQAAEPEPAQQALRLLMALAD